MRIHLCHVVCLLLADTRVASAADDLVFFTSGPDGTRTAKAAGQITEFTGRELTLRSASGRESSLAFDRVIRIETTWPPAMLDGDKFFEAGQWEESLFRYRKAYEQEKRPWARRKIAALCVRCYHNLGQIESAGDAFLLDVFRSDPATQYLDALPLTWKTVQPTPGTLRRAKVWLAMEKNPAAQLLGASWLLPTAERSAAIQALQNVQNVGDTRLAQWATAQLWRTQVVTAKAADVAEWRVQVERFPKLLRAGPSFVAGQALSRLGEHEQAALAFLRVPILYRAQHELAADSLVAAGREMEKLNRPEESLTLLREAAAEFPTTAAASEARARLGT